MSPNETMQNGTAAATLSNGNHIIQANTKNGSVLFQKEQQLRETTAETAHQREPAAPVTPDPKTEAMICRIADHYRACDVTEGFLPQSDTFATRAVHSGVEKELPHGAVVPAITISSTYKMSPDGKMGEFLYSRWGNPSRKILEDSIANLEDAKYALCLGSGLSAVQAVTMLLNTGDHMVVSDDLYGGTTTMWRRHTERNGITFTHVDSRDTANIKNAIRPNTKLIYVETPSNPSMKVTDLAGVVEEASKHSGIITVCDNTFLSPYFQRPLNLGIDIVVESMTKYMNGHSDVIMGGIATNREDLYNRLNIIEMDAGLVPSPFDCYLAFRGLRTLHVRMPRHMRNALTVATFLEQHPCVEKVLYPGLPSHPQHALMKRQAYGCSGMIAFFMRGQRQQVTSFFSHLRVFRMAVSLGGYESLAVGPAFSTHAKVPKDVLESLGITHNMVRLSVGLEDPRDLCRDLDQALRVASA